MQNRPRHILITGERGAGKSTLVRRLVAGCGCPVYGFVTRRLEPDATGFHPIHIYPAGQGGEPGPENLVGSCNSREHESFLDVFNGLGASLLNAPGPGIIVMDELGFMEAKAQVFTAGVLAALNGQTPVLAVLKARRDVPFLEQVCAHPNCTLHTLTKENREQLFLQLSAELAGLILAQ